MMKWIVLAALAGMPAMAEDYCGLAADKVAALPKALDDGWDGTYRSSLLVMDGKPVDPGDDLEVGEITLTGRDGKLALAADDFFPSVTFEPTTEAADYALPGESPLDAAEFLAPEVKDFAIPCDPATLPQFEGKMALDGGATSRFRIIAVSPDQLVMVVQAQGGSQAARAVFDLHRAGHVAD